MALFETVICALWRFASRDHGLGCGDVQRGHCQNHLPATRRAGYWIFGRTARWSPGHIRNGDKMNNRRGFLSLFTAAALALATGQALAAAPKRVVLLVNGTLGDKSFFDSAANGMKMIKEKYGPAVQTKIIEISYDQSKWLPTTMDIAAQDWDLVIACSFQMTDIIIQAAAENPDRKFAIFDSIVPYENGQNKNVYSVTFKQNEASYLAGVMAAGLLKSGTLKEGTSLGFLGGLDIPVINDFLVGYVDGAQAVDPKIKVAVSYIGSFSDAAKGKELALAQYRTGTAIGFNVAGQAGLGQLAAAKELGRYAIGVDSDQEAIFRGTDPAMADRVVTSVVKRIDIGVVRTFDLLMQDKFPGGKAEALGLSTGAVGIIENDVYKKVVPAAVRDQVTQAGKDIGSGKINVPSAFGMETAKIQAIRDQVRP
jgi:basic membrane protein A